MNAEKLKQLEAQVRIGGKVASLCINPLQCLVNVEVLQLETTCSSVLRMEVHGSRNKLDTWMGDQIYSKRYF